MKIREIYGDILGRIAVDIPNDRITSGDIVSIIWESAGQVRQQYFNSGVFEPFAITQSVDSFNDAEYPGFKHADVDIPIYKSLPIRMAVLGSFVSKTANKLDSGSTDTFHRGDNVRKGDRLLLVLENDVPGSYDGPIVSADNLRHFKAGNGAKLFKDQWFYDKGSDSHYVVRFDFVDDGTSMADLEQQGIIEQTKAMDVGPAFVEANLTSITNLSAIRALQSDGDGAVGFAIQGDMVLMGTNSGDVLLLTYVPELARPTKMDDDIIMPEFAISQITMLAIQKIAYAIGVTLPEALTEETDEDDEPTSE